MTKEELIKNQFPNDEFLQSAVLHIVDKCTAELDCQKNRNKFCYSCANATERCFTNEIGCPCEKYKSYKDENAELQAQIEKLIDFVLSKTECCDVCPITDTCINSEGTCPYAGILAKGEEAVTREWLMQKIVKEIKEK